MAKSIYTVQISNLRAAHMEDVPVLDITVKSGDRTFAPTWDMVLKYKAGELTTAEYMGHYRRLMLMSQDLYDIRWREIMGKDQIALACYCKPGAFCHRLLLKDMLMELWHAEGEDVIDGGELTQLDT